MRRNAVILVTVLLVAACDSSAATTSHSASPSASPSASSSANCGRDTCHFDDDILAFDYPASWHQATYNVISSFSNDLVYLSTAPLSDPCDRTPSSVSCVRLAATSLGTNGVLATWTAWGWPEWTFDPNKGSSFSVGQRQATLMTQTPDESCVGIGGVREIVVVVPRSAPDNWMQLDACLAGPDPSSAQGQVEAMLTTVRWSN
jgi:hypothetical protein